MIFEKVKGVNKIFRGFGNSKKCRGVFENFNMSFDILKMLVTLSKLTENNK